MIIDVHTHVPTHRGDVPLQEERSDGLMRADKPVRLTNSTKDYFEAMLPVDRSIVFGIARRPDDRGMPPGLVPPGDVNEAAAAVVSMSPEKVIGFMSVHPDDPSVMDEMERCVHELGLRGIKLGPNYQGFDPLGGPARRVYDYAQHRALPIIFHQGTSPFPNAPLRYAHPLLMDEIAMDFPDLKIVMAHLGHPWHADGISVVRKHPNVYTDVSGQFYRPWYMYNVLISAYEWRVMDKILFASDWPVSTPSENLAAFRGFNEFARKHHLPEVPDDALEGIINRDSLGLLGLV